MWLHDYMCLYVQVKDEIAASLDFLQSVYGVFGFTFKLYLSTRPEKYMGDIALWNKAEKVSVLPFLLPSPSSSLYLCLNFQLPPPLASPSSPYLCLNLPFSCRILKKFWTNLTVRRDRLGNSTLAMVPSMVQRSEYNSHYVFLTHSQSFSESCVVGSKNGNETVVIISIPRCFLFHELFGLFMCLITCIMFNVCCHGIWRHLKQCGYSPKK